MVYSQIVPQHTHTRISSVGVSEVSHDENSDPLTLPYIAMLKYKQS